MSAKLTTRFAYTATKDAATISLRAIEGTQTSKSVRPAEFYSADTWLNEQRGECPQGAQATGPCSVRSGQNNRIKRRPYCFSQLLWIEGLRQKRQVARWSADCRHFGQITGGQQNLRRRAVNPHPISKVAPAHIRQHDVTDDEIDGGILNQTLGFVGAERLENIVAEHAQCPHRDVPHANVVFHYQDGFVAVWQFPPLSVGGRGRRRNLREVDVHGGAFGELTLNGDVTATLTNNSIASSEGDPAAVTIIVLRKVRFEKMVLHVLAHPHAIIDDANADVFARWQFPGRFAICRNRLCFQYQCASRRHRIACVNCEVNNNLGELIRIDFDVSFFRHQLAKNGDVFAEQPQD